MVGAGGHLSTWTTEVFAAPRNQYMYKGNVVTMGYRKCVSG